VWREAFLQESATLRGKDSAIKPFLGVMAASAKATPNSNI